MTMPLECLHVQQMASGNASLLLTECIDWETFPTYAEEIVRRLEGSVVDRVDGPDERVWSVIIASQRFWLAVDDLGVSLDAKDADASASIPAIRQRLLAHRVGRQ